MERNKKDGLIKRIAKYFNWKTMCMLTNLFILLNILEVVSVSWWICFIPLYLISLYAVGFIFVYVISHLKNKT